MQRVQKGNVLLIVLVVAVLALGAGGYYFYTKGNTNKNLIPKALNQNRDVGGTDNSAPSTPLPAGAGNTINEKMFLTITSPRNGDSINSRAVTVTGQTVANADVFVNDQQTKADANGNFSYSITLDEGANEILVTANDSEGNAVEQDLSVNIQTF